MEQILKQRLVGAIVLISLAVIFIPIILEGPDDEWMPRSHTIPEPPQMDYGAAFELPVPAGETAVVNPEPLPEEVEAAVEVEGEAVEAVPFPEPTEGVPAAPVVAETPVPQAAEATAAPPPDTSLPADAAELPSGGWVIQVGSFSSEGNASGLRERLSVSGYAALVQDVTIGQRRTYRVVVGPLEDRADADQMRDRLEHEMQLRGIVVENKG
ncbi:MAG: SPOR domain-containing protein [Gammaproteobacteria bacterium]